MKKFFKTVVGLGAVAAIAGGIYYVYKNYLADKDDSDLDDEDFDDFDDLDDEDSEESRGYVTLNMESEEDADSDAAGNEGEAAAPEATDAAATEEAAAETV